MLVEIKLVFKLFLYILCLLEVRDSTYKYLCDNSSLNAGSGKNATNIKR